MANYTLTIDLQGADKAEGAIDSLMAKVKGISSGKMPSFMDWMDAGSEAPAEGEKIGEKFADGITKGATKKLKSFNILDAWGKSIVKGTQDFWNDAIKNGKNLAQSPPIKGLRDIGGADLAKIFNLPDINSYAKPPPIPQKMDWKKLLLGIGIGITGNDYVGSRLISDQLGKGGAGGVAGGLFGKGGIVGFAEIFAAFKVLKYSIDIFKWSAEIFRGAVKQAASFYAKALTSGYGLQNTIRRSILSDILGVSEQDLQRFGSQIAYLNPKIAEAARIFEQTNKPLTAVGIEMKVFEYNAEALAAQLANDVTPAIFGFLDALNILVSYLEKHRSILFGIATAALELIPGGSILEAIANHFQSIGQGLMANATSGLQTPQAFMKQLPASTWQHMGLALQGGNNTLLGEAKKTNGYLRQIHQALVGGVPRTFGMSPNTANP